MSLDSPLLRRVSPQFDVFAYDATPHLPVSWVQGIRNLVDRFGVLAHLDGSSVTSREHVLPAEQPADLTVVDGATVEQRVRGLLSCTGVSSWTWPTRPVWECSLPRPTCARL